MGALNKKLRRTIRSTLGQFLAVAAVVALGVSAYIAMSTAYYNLDHSRELFYRESNFADYYFQVIRAPQQITRQIEAIPGVLSASGRIQEDVPVIKDDSQRATARLISYPSPAGKGINRVRLLDGRWYDEHPQGGGVEVLLEPQYTAANKISFNDSVTIVAGGRRIPLTVTGTATSPEFIYPMKDASSFLPEPKTFGIIMLPHDQAQQILGYTGQINQVIIKLSPGSDEKKIARQIESLLEPYGNLASYPRKKQLSHAVLQGELDGLKASVRFLPAIFLGIAAAVQFVMLGRMVKAQRMQIGVLKALGYGSREIMLHYTGYAQIVALAGALLGSVLGLSLASVISRAYAQFFNLPDAIGGVNAKSILYGFILSLSVSTLAGLMASRSVTSISPAESMRPEPPRGAGKIFLEYWPGLWHRLDPAWKMGLRSAGRNKIRFGVSLLGVAFAVGMLVVSLFANDSIDYMINRHYYKEQHYNLLVRFNGPVRAKELYNISRIDGVIKTEPFFEIPVRIEFNGRTEEELLQGLPEKLTLKEITGEDGAPLEPPPEGMIISRKTADKLGVRTGDRVKLETLLKLGPAHQGEIKIAGISTQLIGSGSYLSLGLANRIMQESGIVSGAMIKVQPGTEKVIGKKLGEMTGISSITSRQKELDNFNKNLESMVYSISVMIIFAVALGFAIVYNASVMSFTERKRELASLRVVGFTSREVSGLLLKETLLQSLLGVALGLPLGLFMARGYIQAVSTDLFSMPVVVYPLTYFFSALGGIVFIMLAHLLAARGVGKLDLVDVLKNRD